MIPEMIYKFVCSFGLTEIRLNQGHARPSLLGTSGSFFGSFLVRVVMQDYFVCASLRQC